MQFNILTQHHTIKKNSVIMAGEANAEKVKLALLKLDGDNIASLHEDQFPLQHFNSFNQIAEKFLQGLPVPESVCIAIPVTGSGTHVSLPGLSHHMNGYEIAKHLGIAQTSLISEHEAIAYGVTMLNERDLKVVVKGEQRDGNIVIIAPGTGLAESGLYWDGNYYHPFAPKDNFNVCKPVNNFDVELFAHLQQKFGKVTWDLLISNAGIIHIYDFLRMVKERQEPGWLKEKFKNGNIVEIIIHQAKNNELCKETLQYFLRYLALRSAQLVLKFNAVGGLFIAGPIATRMIPQIDSHLFYTTFNHPAESNSFLNKVPIKIITNPKTAMLGAIAYTSRNIFSNGV